MPKFTMLVGLPASGKDTWARGKAVICSSDEIREELFGDPSCQINPSKVFEAMKKKTMTSLESGQDVIYNATNLTMKNRRDILLRVRKLSNIQVDCKVFAVPLEICKERNRRRKRKVSEHVFDKMIRSFQMPCLWEGFDDIEIIKNSELLSLDPLFKKMENFNQNNPHHTLPLGAHCRKAYEIAVERGYSYTVQDSAMLHDIGKLFTQFEDEAGRSHYYQHEAVSSYLALTAGFSAEVCALISWHMLLYHPNKKYVEKMRNIMKEDFYHALEQLYFCDLEAR